MKAMWLCKKKEKVAQMCSEKLKCMACHITTVELKPKLRQEVYSDQHMCHAQDDADIRMSESYAAIT